MTITHYGANSTDLLLMGAKVTWVFIPWKMLRARGWRRFNRMAQDWGQSELLPGSHLGWEQVCDTCTSELCCFWGRDGEIIHFKNPTNQQGKSTNPKCGLKFRQQPSSRVWSLRCYLGCLLHLNGSEQPGQSPHQSLCWQLCFPPDVRARFGDALCKICPRSADVIWKTLKNFCFKLLVQMQVFWKNKQVTVDIP